MSMSDVIILHLSDVHAGASTYTDVDGKVAIAGAATDKPLDVLRNYISSLTRMPDFVVVSGDITIKGDRAGLEQVRDWLIRLSNDGLLPPPDRILVVPGNHDVTRRARPNDDPAIQFRNFWEVFGRAFPHAHVPGFDPTTHTPTTPPDPSGWGGILSRPNAGELKLEKSLPYLLDLTRDVLIYGFNSAHGCGMPLSADTMIEGKLKSLIDIADGSTKPTLIAVRDRYLDTLVVDAGMLTDGQLQEFADHMKALRAALPDKFDKLTKIAVLHHHIGHLWQQQLEIKSFEAVIDAAKFKQVLTENAFDIVLHGHKHTNHVGIDGALIPVDRADRFNPLCVVSGGTIGGHPRTNDRQSFKLIELAGTLGPRRTAIVREVPILPVSTPAETIARDARVYNLPLADRFPSLHDLTKIKDGVDATLVSRLAPELRNHGGVSAQGAHLDTGQAELFDATYPYRCYAYTDGSQGKRFYEVIQATRTLKFGTIARLQWLISTVIRTSTPERQPKVVVLIGNLERTHYSEARKAGETAESIDELRRWLKPACEAGHVEVRDLSFTQEEVADLVKAITP